jgi:hypothetical protein
MNTMDGNRLQEEADEKQGDKVHENKHNSPTALGSCSKDDCGRDGGKHELIESKGNG